MQILVCFVAFLLCDKRDYLLLLPPDVNAMIKAFAQTPPPSQLLPPIFENGENLYCIRLVEILTKIWTQTWEPTLSNFMTDPTMCFVTLSCIRRDHDWAEPTQVCHKLHSAISPSILQQFLWSQQLQKALEETF